MIEADPVLGKPLANYPSNRQGPLLVAALVCAAAAVLLNFTLAAVPEWWGPTLTMVLMALLVLAFGWYIVHIWNREVILYEHGFSYREGSNTVYFTYGEIKSVRQRAERLRYFGGLWRRDVYQISVRTMRDEVITLSSMYRRVDELGLRLEKQFNTVRRPVVEEMLKRGESVPFGAALALTANGLTFDQHRLAWAEFAGFRAQGGRLLLLQKPAQEWQSLPLDEIDNLLLLLDFLRAAQPTGGVSAS
ncbi:MAG: hypothetical protein HXY40_10625 [Chloroflexi bacterium]|nr:hypothetical protein [Chloroflexota bacterium]